MKDEASRAPVARRRRKPENNYSNLEFIGNAHEDPKNILRSKLKDLAELPKQAEVRRVIVITDVGFGDERDIKIVWSGRKGEDEADAEDSVLSLLARALGMAW